MMGNRRKTCWERNQRGEGEENGDDKIKLSLNLFKNKPETTMLYGLSDKVLYYCTKIGYDGLLSLV